MANGETNEFNMDAAVDSIGSDLGLDEPTDTPVDDGLGLGASDDAVPVEPVEPAPLEETPAPVAKQAPQSWAKEKHELWSKLPPEAQEYYEIREKQMLDGLDQYKEHSAFGKQMRDVMNPYKAFLTAQGVDEPKAAQYLLNAHYRLTNGSQEEKANHFRSLAQSYGIDLGGLQPTEQAYVDPTVKALQDKLHAIESKFANQENSAARQSRERVAAEVETFAKDPKNQYFDECADEISALVQAGHTLEAAYEKAVYANPVTRAKEIARLHAENDKTLREKSKLEVEAARKAASTNLRNRDTRRAPTEPKGTMEDTMRAALAEMRERVH
tara:strand:- start:538 stop:1518 length:981 start_codon:yes stop_codon:yes gene_type:complete